MGIFAGKRMFEREYGRRGCPDLRMEVPHCDWESERERLLSGVLGENSPRVADLHSEAMGLT
jgi:hypothetical protein